MFTSKNQVDLINTEFQKLGARGVTILAASGETMSSNYLSLSMSDILPLLSCTGDGGSHFAFGSYPPDDLGTLLNQISCKLNFPTFPASSPYVLAVGGTAWPDDSHKPVYWKAGLFLSSLHLRMHCR